MYTISDTAKLNIERTVGMDMHTIQTLTYEAEKQWVENRVKRSLYFSRRNRNGIFGRGNPLLARRKIRTMEDLDKKSRKLIGI